LQTWDVIESPMFAAVFSEAADTCLKSVITYLKVNVFTPQDGDEEEEEEEEVRFRSPPLATLLPRLKGAALRLLPSDPSTAISADVREIISSSSLDTLCVSLFDLGLPRDSSSVSSTNTNTNSSSSSCSNYNPLSNSQKSISPETSRKDKDEFLNGHTTTNWPF
jgi:hypothetical protein